MRVEWDERKNRANRRKHGVSFELAQEVFDDPLALSRLDRVEGGEERWHTLHGGRHGSAARGSYGA